MTSGTPATNLGGELPGGGKRSHRALIPASGFSYSAHQHVRRVGAERLMLWLVLVTLIALVFVLEALGYT